MGAALVLVERVQPDPRQVRADQVARLSIETNYQLPDLFQSMVPDGAPVVAFQEFYGLRAVIMVGGPASSHADEECLIIFRDDESEVKDESESTLFSGGLWSGCVAGPFPAMTQFQAGDKNLPAELQSAFPGVTALQVVYDSVNKEIVIFTGE